MATDELPRRIHSRRPRVYPDHGKEARGPIGGFGVAVGAMLAGARSAVADGVIERVTEFYSRKRVLVTGGMSFIGSHLTEALLAAGANVTVADDLSSGREANLGSSQKDVRFVKGDLRDPELAAKAAESNEIVFHLAAVHGGRGYIDTHPVECVGNMALDHSVFTAAARAGVWRIVFASSACVYPTNLQASADSRALLVEDDAGFDRRGQAFADGEYGWAKLMGELQLRAFHKQYGLDGIGCRIFTAYGERENESHAVIALIAKAIAHKDPYPIWGNGLQTRNFTYVADTVAGLLLSGARLSGFSVINVGNSQHVSIRDLIQEIFAILAWRPRRITYELDKPVGVKSRAADLQKCRSLLAWEPSFSLHEGLTRTVEWYRDRSTESSLRSLDSLLMSR